jgi:hypothetical protein
MFLAVLRPFRPSPGQGPYRLPHDIRDRLVLALAAFRYQDAALTLAVFLAQFWSVPGRAGARSPLIGASWPTSLIWA